MKRSFCPNKFWIGLIAAVAHEGYIVSGADAEPAVLYSLKAQAGDQKITYQRIAPLIPAQNPSPLQAPMPVAPETLESATYLNLSCTVYGGQLTEVRWWHEGGEYRAYSSLNFHLLRSLGRFEFEGGTYSLFLGIGDEPLASLAPEFSLAAFQAAKPAQADSWYQMVSSPAGELDSDALAGLEVLHRYFDAHKTALLVQWQAAEALAAQPKTPVAIPAETVIRFWPRKSRVHLPANAEAAP